MLLLFSYLEIQNYGCYSHKTQMVKASYNFPASSAKMFV